MKGLQMVVCCLRICRCVLNPLLAGIVDIQPVMGPASKYITFTERSAEGRSGLAGKLTSRAFQ